MTSAREDGPSEHRGSSTDGSWPSFPQDISLAFAYGSGVFQTARDQQGQMDVKMLVQGDNGKLRAALVANLKSAVTASLLMLPESFSEEELCLQIAGLFPTLVRSKTSEYRCLSSFTFHISMFH
uniref:Phosphatidate cytidylyltransferase, mitochondrial n=1 Tax=Knipowitschia caucasica TaxID=637954 RepID=A0AAV2M483_KNICA